VPLANTDFTEGVTDTNHCASKCSNTNMLHLRYGAPQPTTRKGRLHCMVKIKVNVKSLCMPREHLGQ